MIRMKNEIEIINKIIIETWFFITKKVINVNLKLDKNIFQLRKIFF